MRSVGLIFPSNALEGAPLVYGEAMQAGLPIIAADGTTLALQTKLDGTGAVFLQHDERSLRDAIAITVHNRNKLAHQAQHIYRERYTPDVWLEKIGKIYASAIEAHPQPV